MVVLRTGLAKSQEKSYSVRKIVRSNKLTHNTRPYAVIKEINCKKQRSCATRARFDTDSASGEFSHIDFDSNILGC